MRWEKERNAGGKNMEEDSQKGRLVGLLCAFLIVTSVLVVSAGNGVISGSNDPDDVADKTPIITSIPEEPLSKGSAPSSMNISEKIKAVLAEDRYPFLFFYAEWCGFCNQQKPILEQLAQEYSDSIEFIWLNAEECRTAAREFGVTGYPAMFLILGGADKEYHYRRFEGFTPSPEFVGTFELILGSGSEEPGWNPTEKLPDAGREVHLTADSNVTCTSCEDCTRKLNSGDYDTVILTQNLLNHTGNCITLTADNVVFDCAGHFISGDLPAAPFNVDYGIKVTGDNNVIKKCNVGLFWYGIWLDSANFTTVTENNLALNAYSGLTLTNSNNNNITANTMNFNSYGLAILNSNNTVINSNAACGNLIADIWQENSSGNAGSNNTCYNTHDWNDTGAAGCTHLCCLVPSNDMRIEKDTKFCPGWYNITDSGAQGAIIINASNIVLDGNGATLMGSGAGYGIYNPGFNNVTITNVTIRNYGTGIQLVEADNSIISENEVSYSAIQGIALENSQECDVSGNRVSYSAERGIVLSGGGDNAAYNNLVFNNSAFGAIEAVFSDNNEIYNNTAYCNQWGIATNHGSSNLIHNNTLYRNELGVHLDWPSTNNRVIANNISSNYAGIWINHNSTSNIISGNLIVANEASGIGIETNSNLITNNTAHHNRVGLYLGAATAGNTVTHNRFCNNTNFDIRDDNSNSGDENTCGTQNGWDDEGTTGCTYPCVSGGESDLIITDIWPEGDRIGYQVRNIGNDTAPGGHWAGLVADGVYVVNEQIAMALEQGERYTGHFDYDWRCTEGEAALIAVADYYNQVAESDETNNLREEIWKCDTTPPRIILGPIVSEVTQTSALVTWETDEASSSVVHYGRRARYYPFGQADATLVQEHELVLTGLEPSTTYNAVALSTDNSGNTVQSAAITFETAPLNDTEYPVVTLIDPGICRGVVNISAIAVDNIRVRKVEFFVDDVLVLTDFSPPFELRFDSGLYENGNHTIKAKVHDLAGNIGIKNLPVGISNLIDATAPDVYIYHPSDYATVAGEQRICVVVTDDTGVSAIEFLVDGQVISSIAYPTTHSTVDFSVANPYWWDTRFLENKLYRIAVRATDKTNKIGLDTVDVYVNNTQPPLRPELVVTRHEVTRHRNTFAVELEVKNQGTATAYDIKLEDYLSALQPISRANFNGADYEAEYIGATNRTKCVITDHFSMSPGSSQTYSYSVVPVLMHPTQPQPSIGTPVHWSYRSSTGQYYSSDKPYAVLKTTDNVALATAFDQALKEADYLIVTNPSFLIFWNAFQRDEVDALLSDMAELAFKRNGVLGYLYVNNETTFRNLIRPTGTWASELHPNFSKSLGGYLLIVGEIEIIPARREWGFSLTWSNAAFTTTNVPFSDHPYSDTNDDGLPDLIVGRIVGNDALNLSKAIRTSIGGYSFDRSHATVVSGTDGKASIQKMFTDGIDAIEGKLKNKGFSVTKIHWKNYATNAAKLQAFRTSATDKDVLCYDGHGLVDEWAGGLVTSDFPVNFGTTSPFVFSLACLTGSYEDHPDFGGGDYNIAEAFLNSNTAVFIGATQVSPVTMNGEAGDWYFEHWDADEPIGEVFTELERGKYSTKNSYWGLWVWEYNLYGDPKFGVVSNGVAGLGAEVPPEATSALEVVVPDYVVTTSDEFDHVKIPGGELLLENGLPQVPYYTISTDYPRVYKVQNVTLRERTGLQTATGLNLPVTVAVLAASGELNAPAPNQSEDWFPNETYRWRVVENPDGTSTLVLTLYPFTYNPRTTNVRFYQNFSFEINYTESAVTVDVLRTDKDAYARGETVTVDVGLNNTGDAEEVVVSAVVKRYGSEELVDGLLLTTLSNFSGPASFLLQWDSGSFEPGDYAVEVILRDAENVLDTKTVQFWLGISSGVITALTATPEQFELGHVITINMTFTNTGTVDLTGTAIVRVLNEAGDMEEEYRHNVSELLPSESISFSNTWNTTGAAEGLYRILGSVLYESMSTDPVSVMVGTATGGFDTGAGTYPSIAGTHNGTITPNQTMLVRRLHTYSCPGMGGHAEYVKIWQGSETLAEASWAGYDGDWQNITFDAPIVLEADETYHYSIDSGSYPQIIHADSKDVTGGRITCTSFVDINGMRHEGWIPAIRLQ